jgi:hypothetical protein
MGLKENEDYYIDKGGLLVFTAKYLLERGYCCGNGCRHCPYDKGAQPLPSPKGETKANTGADDKNDTQ